MKIGDITWWLLHLSFPICRFHKINTIKFEIKLLESSAFELLVNSKDVNLNQFIARYKDIKMVYFYL